MSKTSTGLVATYGGLMRDGVKDAESAYVCFAELQPPSGHRDDPSLMAENRSSNVPPQAASLPRKCTKCKEIRHLARLSILFLLPSIAEELTR
jgi:hypothetical protein